MTPAPRVLLGFAAALVVAAIVGGIAIIGPPSEERLRRIDDTRVEQLAALQRVVGSSWNTHARLPASLDEAVREQGVTTRLVDPVTSQPYEYRPLDDRRFELCATFDRESTGSRFGANDRWSHGAGRRCFTLTVSEPH